MTRLIGTQATGEIMSGADTSQGEGWWQADDGKWYPAEDTPGPALGIGWIIWAFIIGGTREEQSPTSGRSWW